MNSTALDFHGHYEQKDGRRSSLADRRANANRCRFHGRLEQLETRLVLSFTAVGSFGDGKAAWVDFNQDGWTDLASGGTLYRNNNGTLTSFTSSSGDGVWGDYDNDGYPDLYSYSNRGFMRNNKGMNLISGANMPGPPAGAVGWGRGATFGDFNGDGFLDLYLGGYESWPDAYYRDTMWFNNGGRSFNLAWTQGIDAVVTAGWPRPARGVTTLDFDEDGDLDIYVSNYRLEPNALWMNNGRGNISDVAGSRGATAGTGHTIGSAVGDIDNDGHLDLFAGNFSHNWFSQPGAQFLRNTGDTGGYSFQNMVEWIYPHGEWQESYASPSLADYDNDGDLDLFFTTVYGGDAGRLYRNDGNWNFSNVTSSEGLSGQPSTYQNAWADYDNDGDLDLITGGTLYRNNTSGNNWLKVKLTGDGVDVNSSAIGAIVRISVGGKTMTRQVEGATGEGNQNDFTLHFGLGKTSGNVSVGVTWPDGSVETVSSPVNQVVLIGSTPAGTPLEPEDITVESITNESAVIRWKESTDPDGDSVTYEVKFRKNDQSDSWSTTRTTSVPQLMLTNLEPGTAYRVQIRATDGELFSEWVEAVNLFSTTAAPSAPGSLSVMSITHTSALVLWQPSPDVNFSTVAYEVQYRKSDLSDDWHLTSPTSALGQMIGGLQMGTSYRVRVRAFSGQLYSDWRDVNQLFTTTMDEMPPSAPGELAIFSATETTALVTWGAATDPNGDPVVYQVEYRKSDLSDDWTPTAATTALGQQLGGLQPGTSYRVRVRGFDGQLYGPWADINNLFITMLNTPTAPTIPGPLSTEWVTERLAMLHWGESLDPNGDEVTYYVEFRKADLSTDWALAFSTKATEHALIGLASGTSYHVRVLAYDGGLASDWQQADNLFTTALPEGTPTTPGSLSVITILETTALVSWDASSDSNNDELIYEVEFRQSNSGADWTVTTPIQSLGRFLEGLSPGTSYDVRVRAFDGQLHSLWREADQLFTTLGTAAIAGDINQDGLVDALDIDGLFSAISSSATDDRMDLNEDNVLDKRDVDYLVRSILGTNYGDTNLNGRIDTADLTRAIIHFTSAGGIGMKWSDGDTDGDGDVDSGDLTTAIINFTGA